MPKQSIRSKQLRQQIADYAAKLIYESGIRDYQLAKQKAANALGFSDAKCLPTNQELEAALLAHINLFDSADQSKKLIQLRKIAIKAMQYLQQFSPRLVGNVLSGTASKHDSVVLHLFCDITEQVGLYLNDTGVPFEEKQRRIRLSQNEYTQQPMVKFIADATPVELILFSQDDIRQSPLSPIDSKPMQRAALAEVESLIQ